MIYIDIYRYKQYIINIKIVKILITITATAMMLVINNNSNNYNCKKKTKKKMKGGEKAQKTSTYTHMLKKLHKSLADLAFTF